MKFFIFNFTACFDAMSIVFYHERQCAPPIAIYFNQGVYSIKVYSPLMLVVLNSRLRKFSGLEMEFTIFEDNVGTKRFVEACSRQSWRVENLMKQDLENKMLHNVPILSNHSGESSMKANLIHYKITWWCFLVYQITTGFYQYTWMRISFCSGISAPIINNLEEKRVSAMS